MMNDVLAAQHKAHRERQVRMSTPPAICQPEVEVPETPEEALLRWYRQQIEGQLPIGNRRRVIALVARYYGQDMSGIMSSLRWPEYVRVRYVAMYVLKTHFQLSLLDIARALSRDHTTVTHGLRKMRALLASNDEVANDVAFILRIITAASPRKLHS